jgi:hypothetical protein
MFRLTLHILKPRGQYLGRVSGPLVVTNDADLPSTMALVREPSKI